MLKNIGQKYKAYINNFLNIVVLIIVLITLLFSIQLVRKKLLQNTQDLGMSLAQSYANQEEMYLESFRNFLELGAKYIDDLYEEGNTEKIQPWLKEYFEKISVILGRETVDAYAIIDGEIVAANPWEGDEEYDYEETMWYQQAIDAKGEIIYTDVYKDAITGQAIITLAKELNKAGDVLVLDVYPEKFHEYRKMQNISEDSSFYLCDSKGNLIYSETPWNLSKEKELVNVEYLLAGIKDGSLVAYDASFTDYEGRQRGLYHYEMENGWVVLLTIPFESILMGEKNIVVYILCAVFVFLFAVLLIMTIKDLTRMRRIQMSENTVRILSDSFYGIYMLDYKKGTYRIIKPSDDIAKEISLKGDYEDLLGVIKTYVEESVREEFATVFSLSQIRERVRENITDYGGDYKRRFGNVYKWVNVRTLHNEKFAPNQVIFCFREVDMEKRQQQQHMVMLRDALETARKSEKEKEAFFNNMSHDMRTPLNAIIGYSELVTKQEGDWGKVTDYMKKITHAGQQLLSLINDILELSRIQSGKNVLKQEQFNIESCIRGCTALFEDLVDKQEKTLKVDIQIQDKEVFGDAFKLEQIMNNLLSNAFKYSNAGAEINVKVRQQISMNRSKYQITVSDTGIGMTEEFLEHIFDPYTRETSFATKAVVGTGLGMPIVKSLVQQFSGEITVQSHLGEGSVFTVTIPMEVVKKVQEVKEEPVSSKDVSLQGHRILLAEDNELNREIATEILQMNGVEVLLAENGEEAVYCFSSSKLYSIDAILMDMQMPVMDGCEATRRIRSMDREDAQKIPIIAVTANAFEEDVEKTMNAGMNGHISKPIDFKILTETLGKFIGSSSDI